MFTGHLDFPLPDVHELSSTRVLGHLVSGADLDIGINAYRDVTSW